MSKWTLEFEQHPFQQPWLHLKIEIESLEVDDQTVTTSVQELARLKRVIVYISALLEKIDPELTPKSVWNNFHPQVEACLQNIRSFAAERNIASISRANENADNLLTYVRPYEVFPQATVEGLGKAARSLVSDLEGYVDSFKEKADSLIREIGENESAASRLKASIDESELGVSAFTKKLFEGEEGRPSVNSQIDSLLSRAGANSKEIYDLHAMLLTGTSETPSIQSQIKVLEASIVKMREKISSLIANAEEEIRGLDEFHGKIFGQVNEEGKLSGGLSQELDERTEQLRLFESEQRLKYKALIEQIETLLPGATSAGLGSAYRTLRDEFSGPIKIYTNIFYGSIAGLVVGALVLAINSLSIYPVLAIDFIETGEWDLVLRAMLYKVPFVAPVVWLALFASKRRSQYERLRQEYAHKEALARSYESYRRQLLDLKVDTEDLQRDLLGKTIEAIAYNASITLDGRHGEKLPIAQLLEKFSIEDLRKLLEFSRRSIP